MIWVYLLIPIVLITYILLRGIFFRYPLIKKSEIPHFHLKTYRLMWTIGFFLIFSMIFYIIQVILRISEKMFWDDWILLPALVLIGLVVWNRLDYIFTTNVDKKPPLFFKKKAGR